MRQPVKRKRRKRARFLSALMAVVLLATTVPSSTFAQQTEESSTEETSTESSTTGSTSGDILNGSNEQNQSTSSSDENSGGNTSGSSSDGGEENISDSSSGGDENIPGSSSEGDDNIPGSSSGGDENIPSPSAGEDEENIPGSSSDGSSSVGPSVPSSESSVEGTSVESSSVPEGGTSLPGDPENGQNGQDNEGLILKVEAYEGTAETVIYWVTEDGDAAERPAAGSYTQFKLYFSIDGGDDTELTNSTKGEVGLIDLPSVSTTDNGDGCGYRLHVEGLPSKLQYVSPETEAMEGVDQREDGEPLSVSWKIVPQDDLAEYTLHEVSDPAEVIYASKGAGWYYVKEAEQPSAPAEETEDEITVTGWRDSYSKTVFWADNQNEGEVRPSVGNYPLPKLYFTYTVTETEDSADMDSGENTSEDNENAGDEKIAGETDGSDSVEGSLTETVSGIELTEESMKQVGLTAMPEIRITDNGDSYTPTIGENILPASFERTKDGVKGTGSVEWEIVLQEVTGYDLVEVTEEDLNERPDEFFYAEATGTYYVIEGLEAEKEEETLEITGWAEESRSTVYWMDYNNGYGTRPDQVTPELYFTMSREDGQEEEGCGKRLQLTEENLSKLGLESMPEFRMESKGTAQKDGEELQLVIKGAGGDPVPFTVDVYEVILDGESLPIALTRTVGEEKTEYIVEWEILPAEVEHYTRMEVTEDNLAQKQEEYPYVTGEGWYYVLDMGEEIGVYSVITTTVERTDTLRQNVYWIDNNGEGGLRPDASKYETGFTPALHYVVKEVGEGEEEIIVSQGVWNTSAQDWGQLGLDIDMNEYPLPEILASDNQNGSYTVSAGGLPVSVTERDSDENETKYEIKWSFTPNTVVPIGYELVEVTEENEEDYSSIPGPGWYYVKLTDFSVNIVLRMGEMTDEEIESIKQDILNQFQFSVQAGNDSRTFDLTSEELKEFLSLEVSSGTGIKTLTLNLSGIRQYNLNGTEISYRIERKDGASGNLDSSDNLNYKLVGDDSIQVEFDNTNVPNQSGNTSAVYSGGSLYLTLTGTTDYDATKVWLDPDGTVRPNSEFQLWRYREGTNYSDAAAVWENGEIKSVTFTSSDNGKKNSHEISFDDLPKYDPEGYEYIYVTREYLEGVAGSGSYEQIFGNVNEEADGSITVSEDLPDNYGNGGVRQNGDTNLYDGGVLSNRITGTIATEGTKIWKASAFQAELSDVSVVFKLEWREKGSQTSWEDAIDENGNPITQTLTGFHAEMLSGVSFDRNVSRYNAFGKEMEYRWVESAVYQGGDTENNLFVPDLNGSGNGSFTLVQDGRTITYGSTVVTSAAGQEPVTTTITNSLRNTIEYDVIKKWEDGRTPEQIQMNLYRTISGEELGEPLITFQMDKNGKLISGSVNMDATQLASWETIKCDEVDDWHALLSGLSEYDEDGRQYEYVLLEDVSNGAYVPIYETERITTPGADYGNYITTVINPVGEGHRVMVRKDWIDDSDTLHREAVTFTVYVKKTDKPVNGTIENSSITLENGIWYDYIGIGDYTPDQVYILETRVGGQDLTWDEEGKRKVSKYPHEPVPNETLNYNTNHHKYEVTYQEKTIAGELFKIAVNRRLGNIDVTVTKTWQDGNESGRRELLNILEDIRSENGMAPRLALRLEFADSMNSNPDYKIDYEDNTVQISPNGDWVPIHDNGGENPASVSAIQIILSVDPSENQSDVSTFYFHDLPKYDANGTTVRYGVREVWVDDSGNEIALSSLNAENNPELAELYARLNEVFSEYQVTSVENYKIDPTHDADDQHMIDITNKRVGLKSVTWYKNWKDYDVYEASKRPDIYLNIYRLVHDENGNEKLELELADYKWTGEEGTSEHNWRAEFTGLSRYDSYGYEITYYAVENTHISMEDFEYKEVEYRYEKTEGEEKTSTEEDGFIGTESKPESDAIATGKVYKVDDSRYALKEEGTFVNALDAKIRIGGQKQWVGLPDDFDMEHLPTITLKLMQTDVDINPDTGESVKKSPVKIAEVTMTPEQMINGRNRFMLEYLGKNVLNIDETTGDLITISESDEINYPGIAKDSRIPKYDDEGIQYLYSIVEEISWPVWVGDNPVQPPFTEQTTEDTKDDTYTLPNTYNSIKGELKAKKLLYLEAGMTGGFPSVTLEVYRRYQIGVDPSDEKSWSGWALADTKTWSAADIQSAYEEAYLPGGGAGTGSANGVWLDSVNENENEDPFVFSGLEIYAPNGSAYQYQIKEVKTSAGAYDTWVVNENASGVTVKNADDTIAGKTPANAEPDGANRYLVSSGTLSPVETAGGSEAVVSVAFLNKQPGNPDIVVEFSGTKVWDDLDNAFGFRPTEDEAKNYYSLWRYAESQPGKSNSIALEEVESTKYVFEWTETQDATWNYQVKPAADQTLERYAPNDMPWIYVIREELPTDSVYIPSSESDADTDGNKIVDAKENITEEKSVFETLTNSILTEKSFQKRWLYEEDTELYLGYLMRITFKLQVGTVDGATGKVDKWTDADVFFADKNLRIDTNKWDPSTIDWQISLPKSGGAAVTSNVWEDGDIFENLPIVIKGKDGNTLHLSYRVVEREIEYGEETAFAEGGIPNKITVTVEEGDNSTYTYIFTPEEGSTNPFEPVYEEGTDSNNADTVIHRNRIRTTEFSITKEWKNDEHDAYGTRPKDGTKTKWEAYFVIQRSTDGGKIWSNVTEDGNNNSCRIVCITGTNNVDKVSIEVTGLPSVSPDGKTYLYRARELYPKANRYSDGVVSAEDIISNNTNAGDPADNYNSAYDVSYSDDPAGTTTSRETVVTNTMDYTGLKAEKKWYGNEKTAVTLRLEYLAGMSGNGDDVKENWKTLATLVLDGNPDTTATYYEYEAWKAKFTHVPVYLPESYLDENAQSAPCHR